MTSRLADFYFVIPHLIGQNPDWSTDDLVEEIERRVGALLTEDELVQLRTLVPRSGGDPD